MDSFGLAFWNAQFQALKASFFNQFFVGQRLITQPIPEATLQSGVWGTDLVEEVLGEIGRVP